MARTKKDSVGIVGLGIMGGAFAQNLLAAGWRVIGYDIAPARRRAIAKLGGEIAADASEVARRARTIIISLPKPSALVETATSDCESRSAAPSRCGNVDFHFGG